MTKAKLIYFFDHFPYPAKDDYDATSLNVYDDGNIKGCMRWCEDGFYYLAPHF